MLLNSLDLPEHILVFSLFIFLHCLQLLLQPLLICFQLLYFGQQGDGEFDHFWLIHPLEVDLVLAACDFVDLIDEGVFLLLSGQQQSLNVLPLASKVHYLLPIVLRINHLGLVMADQLAYLVL